MCLTQIGRRQKRSCKLDRSDCTLRYLQGYTTDAVVTIVGAGNVGHQLAQALHEAGVHLAAVYSRRLSAAKRTTSLVGCQAIDDFGSIPTLTTVVLLCVPDDAISEVAQHIGMYLSRDVLMLHTSGATPMSQLQSKRGGVIWPILSIDREDDISWEQVPIIYDVMQETDLLVMQSLVESISKQGRRVGEEQRAAVHLAATIGNNLIGHLLASLYDYMHEHDLDPLLLGELIRQGISRKMDHPQLDTLTGAAKRGDSTTIAKHVDLLAHDPELRGLYVSVTESILQKYSSIHNRKLGS